MRAYSVGAAFNVTLASGYSPPSEGSINVTLDGLPLDLSGHGFLAGTFPDGITKIEGEPAPCLVRVHYRPEPNSLGDGVLVAQVMSNEDGTWVIPNLNPLLKFDVICRGEGYNDRIWSNVTPTLATGLRFHGTFEGEYDKVVGQVDILLGEAPYTMGVIGGSPPPGVTFTIQGDSIIPVGKTEVAGDFEFTLRVIDNRGISGQFTSAVSTEPLPTVPGEPYGGGFYAGDYLLDGQWYKLITADKAADITGANSRWKTTNTATPGTDSQVDGVSNTEAMIYFGEEFHPAASHCVNWGGGEATDWFMPSLEELRVIYLNLGPALATTPLAFRTGGAQAFTSTYYWASTQNSATNGRVLHFSNGSVANTSKNNTNRRVRPVRRLPFTHEAH